MTEPSRTVSPGEAYREAIGGPEAEAKFRELIGAARAYAAASGCPLGADMIDWANRRWKAARKALIAALDEDVS